MSARRSSPIQASLSDYPNLIIRPSIALFVVLVDLRLLLAHQFSIRVVLAAMFGIGNHALDFLVALFVIGVISSRQVLASSVTSTLLIVIHLVPKDVDLRFCVRLENHQR